MRSGLRTLGGRLAIVVLCAVPTVAMAQEGTQEGTQADVTIGAPDLRAAIGDEPESALSPEDNVIIDKALALDPASFINAPVKPLRLPALATAKGLDLSRTDRPDGSGTVIVKKPLASDWDANIGADVGLPASAPQRYGPNNPLGVTRNDRSTGAAWASLGVTQFATLDARVDPHSEQGRIGTTFKQSLPVGDNFAVSVQSRYSVTETLGQPPPGAPDIPLRAAPVADPAAPVPRVWGNENIAKLNILTTGTTLSAGLITTSTDPVMHNTISAEQKIYGALGLTTAVTDLGRASESKSVSARYKLTW
ncbi:MAG: hypothetical protein Q8M24_22495 [Pseudolabrys sp.]|nr:hypothetical protein [Pseudolabrys sp.]MDP2298223.1 hypothetical protein [Pseudolabrys sp.]